MKNSDFPMEAHISQKRLFSTDPTFPALYMNLPTELSSSSPPAQSVDPQFISTDFISLPPSLCASDDYPPQKRKKSPIRGGDGTSDYIDGEMHTSKEFSFKGQSVRSKAHAFFGHMVGYTADCAAVCCCPLAPLHFIALFCIKLPSAVVKKRMKSLKRQFARKLPAALDDDCGLVRADSPLSWSFKECPDAATHAVHIDSQFLLKHFNAEHLGFGSMSFRMD